MDLRLKLYEKAKAEQESYLAELKQKPPEEIIASAYEKTMRDDILIIFENEDLPEKQVKELLKIDEPIASCYACWLHNDYSHMDMLRDTVSEFANDLVKHNDEQKKAKKKHEPER